MIYSVYLEGLVIMFALAAITWIISVIKHDVSIVEPTLEDLFLYFFEFGARNAAA